MYIDLKLVFFFTFVTGVTSVPSLKYDVRLPVDPFRYTRIFDVSIGRCNEECLARLGCKSINYLIRLHLCELNDFDSTEQTLTDRPGYVYVDRTSLDQASMSYQCSPVCSLTQVCQQLEGRTMCSVTECPVPPRNENSQIQGNLRHIGSQILYQCPIGQTLDPEVSNQVVTSTCLQGGTWSSVTFTCKECPVPPRYGNSYIQGNLRHIGSQILYQCSYGYTLDPEVGNQVVTSTCLQGGTWSSVKFTCKAIATWKILGNISVDNGAPFGSWEDPEYCAFGTYAYSYDLRIERPVGDSTGLNVIQLNCTSLNSSVDGGSITSATEQWGNWMGASKCPGQTFITGFTLQVEADAENDTDKTAANFVKVKCRDFAATAPSVEHTIPPGHGHWGTYGSWSSECGANSAVCGIRTRVHYYRNAPLDDTAVNDAVMYCCA